LPPGLRISGVWPFKAHIRTRVGTNWMPHSSPNRMTSPGCISSYSENHYNSKFVRIAT
jgi:hypothetical protein